MFLKSKKCVLLALIGALMLSTSVTAQSVDKTEEALLQELGITEKDMMIDMGYTGLMAGLYEQFKSEFKLMGLLLPYTAYRKAVESCFPDENNVDVKDMMCGQQKMAAFADAQLADFKKAYEKREMVNHMLDAANKLSVIAYARGMTDTTITKVTAQESFITLPKNVVSMEGDKDGVVTAVLKDDETAATVAKLVKDKRVTVSGKTVTFKF